MPGAQVRHQHQVQVGSERGRSGQSLYCQSVCGQVPAGNTQDDHDASWSTGARDIPMGSEHVGSPGIQGSPGLVVSAFAMEEPVPLSPTLASTKTSLLLQPGPPHPFPCQPLLSAGC